jgi:outer membrane protein assembly complex protein YaeT
MALQLTLPRSFLCASILFSLRAIAGADLAPGPAYEGKPIAGIRFDPAVQPVAEADLNRIVTLQPNQPLHLADVRSLIKRLYATGGYTSIDVDAEPDGDRVDVVIRTAEQWFVGPVEIRGKVKQPPNEEQLTNSTRLALGQPFADDDLDRAVKGMRALLERNGLYLATVTPKVERDAEHQEVSITFDVDSKGRARLTQPAIVGDTRIPPDQLAKAAKYKGWFRWKPATDSNVQAGLQKIRKKYAGQSRLTASVTIENRRYVAEQNRVKPNIRADGGPKVKITAKEAKISQSKLRKYIPVFDENTVNNDLLVSGARNLRDYFQNQGYFDVDVNFTRAEPGPDQETITYVIGLGERHKIVSVTINGNHYFSTAEIRERLYIQPAGFIRLRHGRYSQSFASADKNAIESLYHDNGFRDAEVTVNTVDDYKGKKGDVAVRIDVDEGPQYTVGTLHVNGLDRLDKDTILSMLASSTGQPYSETSVAMDRDYLLNLYQSAGYVDANFTSRTSPGPGPHQMTVDYTITPGQPVYVRDVVITGMHSTRMRLIRPAVGLREGDPLSWTEMGNMQRELYDLGVFDKVDMAIQDPNGDVRNKYVLFHMVEGHRWYTAVGLGAQIARLGGSTSSLNAPAGKTGFAPNVDFEVSRLNLWGLGHSLNFKSRYSTLDRRVQLNYLAPRYRNVEGRNISFTALYDNTRDVLTYIANRYQASIQYSQKLSKPTTWMLRYTWRDVKIEQSTLKINPLLIPAYSQPSHVAEIGTSLVQDRRDDPSNAHRGIYNSVDLDLAAHDFGGNKNFARLLARNSYYKTIFSDLVLASNTEFGVIVPFGVSSGFTDATYVPLPERFIGGGSNSMRGFADNEAGPRDLLTGFPIGGNALLFHSTELRFPLLGDNIGGVVFHDFGNIFSRASSISFRVHQNGLTDFDYMVHAVGFGVRYKTPVGPLRIDLSYAFNPPTFNGLKGTQQQLLFGGATPAVQNTGHFQFFFSIGQAF